MIHLDTSFLIRSTVRGSRESKRMREWLDTRERLGISAVAWAEFLCGPVTVAAMEDAAEMLGEPSPLGGAEATLAAQFFNATGRRRGSLSDCMVAAIAILSGASLATSNVADFQRFARFGLTLAQ